MATWPARPPGEEICQYITVMREDVMIWPLEKL